MMNHYSRRRVLKMVGLVAVASATGHLFPLAPLNAAQPNMQADALEVFMLVSQQLTQQNELNDTVGSALFDAFSQTQKNFSAALFHLSNLLTHQPDLLQQARLQFAETEAASARLAGAILSSWYTGIVGKGKNARYITYINTLANRVVNDKLVPPSFSYGVCGSWASQP
nr:sorbitol dehydrogenase family protein [Pantoea stewartii]